MAHNFGFRRPREYQHPNLSTLSLGNLPARAEAFPELFLVNAPLPKADAPLSSYLLSVESILVHLEEHGSVFTHALRHATRILFSFQSAVGLF
jgi:hypothetical protein